MIFDPSVTNFASCFIYSASNDFGEWRFCHNRFQRSLSFAVGSEESPPRTGHVNKRLCSGSDLSNGVGIDDATRICQSQPEPQGFAFRHLRSPSTHDRDPSDLERERPGFAFSQPAQIEDLLLSSQLNPTQHTQSSNGSQVSPGKIATTSRFIDRLSKFALFFSELYPEAGAPYDSFLCAYWS